MGLTPIELRAALAKNGFNASKDTVTDIIAENDKKEIGLLNFEDFL